MKIKRNLNIVSLDKFREAEKCLWLEENFRADYDEGTDGESDFKIFQLSNEELEIFLETFPPEQRREIICKITVPLEKEQLFLKFFNEFLKNNEKRLYKSKLDSYTVKE